MKDKKDFDVIIVGGSYAGLSAAMALGRSLRDVLIVDSGRPCNEQTPHSHNFLTQDGSTPSAIAGIGKEQVLKYDSVKFCSDTVLAAVRAGAGFKVTTSSSGTYVSKKLLFATGIKDTMPSIDGFAECWGISAIHCPYCHGYEYRNEPTAILANGEKAYHLIKLVSNLTKDLTLLTNGSVALDTVQIENLKRQNVGIIEQGISSIKHVDGRMEMVLFNDKSSLSINALYAALPFKQHCNVPEALGCETTELGHIKIDMFQKTTVDGVFACGDNSSGMRSVSNAVYTGTMAGAAINSELCGEGFS